MLFWNERFPSFQSCRCVCVSSSEGRKEAAPPFEGVFAMAGRSGFRFSSAVAVDFFKPQTHQHWRGVIVDTEPRRLRRESLKNNVGSGEHVGVSS